MFDKVFVYILIITLIYIYGIIKHKLFNKFYTILSLLLFPFLVYTYTSYIALTVLLSFPTSYKSIVISVVSWFCIIGVSVIAIIILLKNNIFPKPKFNNSTNRKITILEQGKSLLKYSLFYAIYISFSHLPINLLLLYSSSIIVMFIPHFPLVYLSVIFIIVNISIIYTLFLVFAVNGVIRVLVGVNELNIYGFLYILLVFIPIINIVILGILITKANNEINSSTYINNNEVTATT